MKEIWLPTSQWPRKLADGKETRSSRWRRVGVWRGGQNNKGRSTTPREVIGFREYKDQYCSGNVQGWRENIELLAEIAKNQPHAAYIAFTKGYKLKFAYFMLRIDSWRLCGTSWWSDQRYFRSSSFWSDGTAPWGVARTIHPAASTRGSGYTRHESWSPTAIRCLKVNNSTACSSYMYAEHLHASGEQTVEDLKRQQQSLKTTAATMRREAIDASLSPDLLRATCRPETKVEARSSTPYPLRSRIWHWISNNSGTRYASVTVFL